VRLLQLVCELQILHVLKPLHFLYSLAQPVVELVPHPVSQCIIIILPQCLVVYTSFEIHGYSTPSVQEVTIIITKYR